MVIDLPLFMVLSLMKKSITMKTKLFISAFFLINFMLSYGQEWTRTYLSQATIRMGGAVLGNEAFFAGGSILAGWNWEDTDLVEIYDIENDSWRFDYLSQARSIVAPASCGDFVFFAGGLKSSNWQVSSRVDIFNSQYYWKETELSIPRFQIAAVSNDSLVLFGGGSGSDIYDVVDVYNIHTEQWSVEHLSIPRCAMGGAVIGDLAIFAGGETQSGMSNRVDIYNFNTRTWRIDSISEARKFIGAAVAGNKVIFAGGSVANGVSSNRVDIYDYETDTWDTASISVARAFYHQSATVDGKAYFVGSGTFDNGWTNNTDTIDIYDPVTNAWSVITLPNPVTENAVVAIDYSLISAGGWWENNPPYGIALDYVEIYTVIDGVASGKSNEKIIKVYPNPSNGNFRLDLPNENSHKPLHVTIYNLQGQEVFTRNLEMGNLEINVGLPAGVYVLKVISDKKTYTDLISIQ